MKKFFITFMILAMCVAFFGCSDSIKLLEGEIDSKITYNDSYAKYYIVNNGDKGWYEQYIFAAPDFANVGDIIGSQDGVIKVIKKAETFDKVKRDELIVIEKDYDLFKIPFKKIKKGQLFFSLIVYYGGKS